MTELVRVHALAQLDPEPEREIQRWRDDLAGAAPCEEEDIAIRLERYETGREIIVNLVVTVELAEDGAPVRRPGPLVGGVWFAREEQAGNSEHARQLVIERVGPLLDELRGAGVERPAIGLPIVVDFDEAVQAALAA